LHSIVINRFIKGFKGYWKNSREVHIKSTPSQGRINQFWMLTFVLCSHILPQVKMLKSLVVLLLLANCSWARIRTLHARPRFLDLDELEPLPVSTSPPCQCEKETAMSLLQSIFRKKIESKMALDTIYTRAIPDGYVR